MFLSREQQLVTSAQILSSFQDVEDVCGLLDHEAGPHAEPLSTSENILENV